MRPEGRRRRACGASLSCGSTCNSGPDTPAASQNFEKPNCDARIVSQTAQEWWRRLRFFFLPAPRRGVLKSAVALRRPLHLVYFSNFPAVRALVVCCFFFFPLGSFSQAFLALNASSLLLRASFDNKYSLFGMSYRKTEVLYEFIILSLS